MKKIVLSLAGVLAAAAFAPEASAVPAFARQTGMACSACHYQHFPLLNGFGRSFKSAAYSMMGAQGKIEGENLSIPDVVNFGGFTTTFVQSQSAGQTAGVGNAVAVPKWGVPGTGGELSLFLGGRISDFAGFLGEAGLGGGGAANTGGIVGAAKLAMLFPVGDARVGTVIYSSNGQGAAYSFELLNTGAANTHKLMGNNGPSSQHVKATSASQYFGTNTAATGVNVVANSTMGFINVGAYEMAGNSLVGGANNLNLTYIRAAATIDLAGWDAGFGIQNFGGKSYVTGGNNVAAVAGTANAPKATIIDAQMQGDLAEMPVGFYASYGTAAAGTATETNIFNPMAPNGGAGTTAATSFNVAAEFGIIPHVSTIQVAMRLAKNGAAVNNTDNALMLGVTYELAQNVALSLTRTQQSGSAWNTDAAGNQAVGKTANTLLLEALF
ncbi:hypothetical protein [Sideroxydans lithotrophicus]|uniref:Cytochrome c domain-containing protein n=1 Tax=Sideroxydans lithotrophicus (strain ES-1) TaxID=580332 RepID=D5CLB8_SIDLE|nr:hypothetical protein [Sideroxydans lithotrophicus]ADE10506.1 conserved hypothetical protein [Sideroxydans lithotrophicus ES-1]